MIERVKQANETFRSLAVPYALASIFLLGTIFVIAFVWMVAGLRFLWRASALDVAAGFVARQLRRIRHGRLPRTRATSLGLLVMLGV